jgi:hypothetical protein
MEILKGLGSEKDIEEEWVFLDLDKKKLMETF